MPPKKKDDKKKDDKKKDDKKKDDKKKDDKKKDDKKKDDKKKDKGEASAPASPASDKGEKPAESPAAAPPPEPVGVMPGPGEESCESCKKWKVDVFCKECDLLLCKICDDQAHSIVALKNHTRLPPAEALFHRRRCEQHPNSVLKYYCDTCEQAVCADCRVFGNHQGQSHVCLDLQEAYRIKSGLLQNMLNNNLLSKKDQLMQQMHRIQQRMDEVHQVKTNIERETRAETDGILDRLRAAEGFKSAILQHDMDVLKEDVDFITNFSKQLTERKSALDIFDFLQRYREMCETCDRIARKPYKTSIDVRTDDFQREARKRTEIVQRQQAVNQLLQVKDQMIEMLLKEKEELLQAASSKDDNNRAAQGEIGEWMRLADRYQDELNRFHMACHYCGTMMNEVSANTVCEHNIDTQLRWNPARMIHIPPTAISNRGSGRHFFEPVKHAVKPADSVMVHVPQSMSNQHNSGRAPHNQYDITEVTARGGIDASEFAHNHPKRAHDHQRGPSPVDPYRYSRPNDMNAVSRSGQQYEIHPYQIN